MNQIFTHPGQSEMQVEVILASSAKDCPPIYTIRMRYPRIIHAEIMTHRVFSRNVRSSRAVPVKTMIDEVRNTPFVPWHWGKNQKGMQAREECEELIYIPYRKLNYTLSHYISYSNHEGWLHAAQSSCDVAQAFMEAGYHKQITNRLLEPFMWVDTLITSTEWSNFLWLRNHKDAEPHLQDLARLVKRAIDEAEIQHLEPGEWHLPYIIDEDYSAANRLPTEQSPEPDSPLGVIAFLRKLSAARCARISYKPFDGDASYERELERYYSLASSDRVHASPLEHQATPDTQVDRRFLVGNNDQEMIMCWANPHLHGNLKGWIQYRKLIPNENHERDAHV